MRQERARWALVVWLDTHMTGCLPLGPELEAHVKAQELYVIAREFDPVSIVAAPPAYSGEPAQSNPRRPGTEDEGGD